MKEILSNLGSLRLSIKPRTDSSTWRIAWTIGVSIVIGFVLIWLVFLATGYDANKAIFDIFRGTFGSWYGFQATIAKSLPLIVVGLGLSVAFHGKFWNIGGEGQFLMGATAAVAVSLGLGSDVPAFLQIILMLSAGMLAGALTGLIPAVLKILGVNEVITTLMINYMAVGFATFLVGGPLRGANQQGQMRTETIPDQAQWAEIPGTDIAWIYLFMMLILVVLVFLLFQYSKKGYEIRTLGENHEAARYAGISFGRTMVLMMLFSGGAAGLAGVAEVASKHYNLSDPVELISGGYGFTAIIVAWLGRLNPFGIIFSGFFFAILLSGGQQLQITGIPKASVEVFKGIMLIAMISGTFFERYRITYRIKDRTSKGANPEDKHV
jgi:ABC-type uncharacterized transport system permease subunit